MSLEDNEIEHLENLDNLQNLMELYIGNNVITNQREICSFKSLPKLIILDIQGNPLCAERTFRVYAIFHLKKLKVLDGHSVEHSEV